MAEPTLPTTDTQAQPSADRALVRAIGTAGLAAAIINVTVGGGIFILPSTIARSLGAAAPLAYLICAVAMGLIVLSIADAGSRVASTGGPYAYVEVAFGPFVGFLSGALLYLVATFAFSAVSTVFALSIGQLIPLLRDRQAANAFLLVVLVGLAAVNVVGVRQGERLNRFATVAKLAPLILLVTVGLFAIEPQNLTWSTAPEPSVLARTSLFLVFAFAGVESALVPSGEVKDPARTVPRGILFAMAGVTVLYIGLQTVAQGVLGADLAQQNEAPLATTAERVMGPWARHLILIGAVVSMFGYLGGMMLAVPRALYALARDGFLPGALARVHDRFRTPAIAIGVQAIVVMVLSLTNTFERLAMLANLSVLLVYGACCAAAWKLRRDGVTQGGVPWRVPTSPIIPWLALAVIAWMLLEITWVEWAAVGGVLVVAAVVYVVRKKGMGERV